MYTEAAGVCAAIAEAEPGMGLAEDREESEGDWELVGPSTKEVLEL